MCTQLVKKSALLVLLAFSTPQSYAAPTAEVFARLPTFTDLAISPGGHYVAARINIEDQFVFRVYDISGPRLAGTYSVAETDDFAIDWFRWVAPDRLLLSVGFSSKRGGLLQVKTEERRLLALDARTQEILPMFYNTADEIPVQIQDRIVSFLPDEPDFILLQYSAENPARPNVYRVNVRKWASHKRVQKGRSGVRTWMADNDGDIRLGWGLIDNESKPLLIIRQKGEDKWQDFSHRVASDSVVFSPRGFSPDPNKMYVLSNHEGEPSGLYTFDIVADEFSDLIFKHPTVDISGIRIDERSGELRSINFIEDELETKRFARLPIQDDVDRMQEQFSDRTIVVSSISDDGQFAVVLSRGQADAGQYMLYDRQANRARALPAQYPELQDVTLGQTFVTEYTARDGLAIPAYITLPPELNSLADAKGLPFVVHPHGGPASRNFLRFDFDVQFLVSRGYGVLQMNFRGSEGYGRDFAEAGRREWGQAMQDDITDGANWLVETGAADPARMAIMGGSYGGYAALMGAVKTPTLYQCAISFAGVSDLPELLKLERRFIGGTYATRFIGDLWKDRKMLQENSPAQRADAIQVPVLLMHGDTDTVVDIDQSERMAKALRKAGKQVEYHVFENGDHHLSLYENRLQYLTRMESFLQACLN